MAQHNTLGQQGEDFAATFLQNKGYNILDRNWKRGDLEIDIVAEQNDWIVFVEVKTRSSDKWGDPEDAVDELRKKRLTAAANAYIKYRKKDNPFRFDVIAIIMNGNGTDIRHIEEAFSPRPRFIGPGSMKPENKWSKSFWKRRR